MLSDFTKTIYEVQFIPFWKDGCNHGEAAYVFSFVCNEFSHQKQKWIKEKLDVYVFENSIFGQGWCLRFGNADSRYYSPTNTSNLMELSYANHEPYKSCINILKEFGKFKWIKDD